MRLTVPMMNPSMFDLRSAQIDAHGTAMRAADAREDS
jgi:hypothetical protein